jgi:hypothetical protein
LCDWTHRGAAHPREEILTERSDSTDQSNHHLVNRLSAGGIQTNAARPSLAEFSIVPKHRGSSRCWGSGVRSTCKNEFFF